MKISLIIPAYNEEHYIGPCLESVMTQRSKDIAEVIVVDNGSTDGTIAMVKKFPEVKILSELKKGPTYARQRGFMEAKNELVAYIDADTRIPPDWAAIAEKEFTKNPKLVSLSGPFRYYDLPPFKKLLAEGLWRLSAMPTFWMTGYMILGANFIVKRAALEKVGGFDTDIIFYGDDTNLAWRLSKVGTVKFNMNFFILGSGRRLTQDGLVKTFYLYAINYLWMATRHKPLTEQYKDVR